MKKLITILSVLPLLIIAQAPQGFTYQGVATDNNGFELHNQTISIQASILSSSAIGTTVWQETHTISTDTFGLFNLVIGEGTSTNDGSSAAFQEIDWGASSHFMKVEIDVNGGSNYVHVGTSQMMSVPYALYAENVHNLNMDSILEAVYDSISSSVSATVSTFGDTLIINGQSIIVPGISYQNAPSSIFGIVTDTNGNTYQTVTIGTQEWMMENLIATSFSNGDPITLQTNTNTCNDPAYRLRNGWAEDVYYNGFAVNDSRNVCPTGWHVPTKADFEILLDVFGDYDAVDNSWSSGAALKSDDGSWTTQSGLGNNDSYLNIVQNGSMYCSSSTAYNTGQARFYTTDHDSGSQFYMTLGEQNNKVYFYSNSGYPSDYLNKVRCVKD